MYEYDEDCLKAFIRNQRRLFDEPVAETLEEAEAFLEDCMAQVFDNINDMRQYFEENMDVSDITDDELLEELEVFKLPSGRYLIVEG